MTDIFNFILVMVSLILAIGVTHLIQRVAELIRNRDTASLDLLQLTWALSLFVLATLYWWSLWDMRNTDWIYPTFFFLLLGPTLLNFAVNLLVATDRGKEGTTAPFDFGRIRFPFMLVMAACSVVVSVDGWIVGAEPAWTAYRPVQFWSTGLYVIGAATRSLTAHRVIAALALLTYVIAGFSFRLAPGAFGS